MNPIYTIVGNMPLTVRESLLPKFFRMADELVKISKKIKEIAQAIPSSVLFICQFNLCTCGVFFEHSTHEVYSD